MSQNTTIFDDLLEFDRIGLNETVCLQVDYRLEQMIDMRNVAAQHLDDPSGIIIPICIILVSVVCLVAGARLFRFTAAFAAFAFAFYAVYTFGRTAGARVTCEVLLLMASVIAALSAFLASCIYKAGLFFVGAAATAFLVHLVFSTFPELHGAGEQPTLANKSLLYWGMMLLAGITGGIILRWHSTPVLEVITACVGGAGLTYALHALTMEAGANVHEWVFVVCGVGAALVGVFVQRHVRVRGLRCRTQRTESNQPL